MGGFRGGHGGGFHVNVNIGGGYIHGYPPIAILPFAGAHCPPPMVEVVQEQAGPYPPQGPYYRPLQRPAAEIIIEPHHRSYEGRPGQGYNSDKDTLNELEAKTHLKFEIDNKDPNYFAKANAEHVGFLSHTKDLRRVDIEAGNRFDKDFVQDLLGGRDSGLQFDGKNVVITRKLTPNEISAYATNAYAIGEAVRGNYQKARDMYDSIPRGDGQTQNNSQAQGNVQGQNQGNGSGAILQSDRSYVDKNGNPVPDPYAKQQAGQQGTQQNQAAPVVRTQPQSTPVVTREAPPPQIDTQHDKDHLMNDKLLVGEAQRILQEKFGYKGAFDGLDTRKDGRQSQTDAALSKVLGHAVNHSMTLGDLKELEAKANITATEKKQFLEESDTQFNLKEASRVLQLSGVRSAPEHAEAGQSQPGQPALSPDVVKAAQNALKSADGSVSGGLQFYKDQVQKSLHPVPQSSTSSPDMNNLVYSPDAKGANGQPPALRDAVYTPQDKPKAVLTDMQQVSQETLVKPNATATSGREQQTLRSI